MGSPAKRSVLVSNMCFECTALRHAPSKMQTSATGYKRKEKLGLCTNGAIGSATDLSIKLDEKTMELNSKQKGKLTELQCITAFIQAGCSVSIPYGDDSRYDFIADIDGQLIKVQVKTSSEKKGTENAIVFSCRSTHVNCNGVKNIRYKANEIDYFATYWDNQCYMVPIQEASTEKTLRFTPPKNGQIKGVSFAKDYLLEKQLEKIKEEVVEH